jgi:hypothetical protein
LRVECWADDQAKDAAGRFEWRCRVSVPGGGLIRRKAHNDCQAPQHGYQLADEIVMRGNDPEQRWSSQAEREYFVKLRNGRYARAKITAFAGFRTFFVLESDLNPSGSPNLEFDPKKEIRTR